MTAQERADICGKNPGPGVAKRDTPANGVALTRPRMDPASARHATRSTAR